METPKSAEEAIRAANALLTEKDEAVLRGEALDMAQTKLHFTLGHQLRNVLGLWREDTAPLYTDLMNQVPGAFLVVDGDSASSAIIEALWRQRNLNAE